MKAPEEQGEYNTFYRLCMGQFTQFGPKVYVQIKVILNKEDELVVV